MDSLHTKLVGRKREQKELLEAFHSGRPEFVALYGRRRVGKTFLIRSLFDAEFTFHLTAVLHESKQIQLENFAEAVKQYSRVETSAPCDWFEAFRQLRELLENANRIRKIVFIDELPWLDTRRSDFLPALESFWNGWASARSDIMLIVCGSAASWISKKLFKSRGGLHNRVTRRILLEPFTLKECREFSEIHNLQLDTLSLIDAYSCLGGIPYYFQLLNKNHSLTQNINRLCFTKSGALRYEFDNLYASLFRNPENHIRIIEALGKKKKGLSRSDLAALTGFPENGSLTDVLGELELSGFIRKYRPYGKKKKGSLYQLIDHFTLFYLSFIRDSPDDDEEFWMKAHETAAFRTWRGYAFEQVCLVHIKQIRQALGVSGVITSTSSWRSMTSDPGAQIDLVIDRNDNTVTLCEMKYSDSIMSIDKSLAANLRNKRNAFIAETSTKKAVQLALVTPVGLSRNQYYDVVQAVVTAKDLAES